MKKLVKWVEIPAENFDRAVGFYEKILSINLEKIDCGIEKMACLPGDEGAISFAEDFKPSADGVLVSLDAGSDIDGMIRRIEKAGGRIVRAKTKIEAEGRGFFALFTDSEGNRLGLYGE